MATSQKPIRRKYAIAATITKRVYWLFLSIYFISFYYYLFIFGKLLLHFYLSLLIFQYIFIFWPLKNKCKAIFFCRGLAAPGPPLARTARGRASGRAGGRAGGRRRRRRDAAAFAAAAASAGPGASVAASAPAAIYQWIPTWIPTINFKKTK